MLRNGIFNRSENERLKFGRIIFISLRWRGSQRGQLFPPEKIHMMVIIINTWNNCYSIGGVVINTQNIKTMPNSSVTKFTFKLIIPYPLLLHPKLYLPVLPPVSLPVLVQHLFQLLPLLCYPKETRF